MDACQLCLEHVWHQRLAACKTGVAGVIADLPRGLWPLDDVVQVRPQPARPCLLPMDERSAGVVFGRDCYFGGGEAVLGASATLN